MGDDIRRKGRFVISYRFETTIPRFSASSFYEDDQAKDPFGASGIWINQPIPSTDPCRPDGDGKWHKLSWKRVVQFAEPGLTVAQAIQLDRQVRNPLSVETANWEKASSR